MLLTRRELSLGRDSAVLRSRRVSLGGLIISLLSACTISNPAPVDTLRGVTSRTEAGEVVNTSTDYRRIENEVVREMNSVREDPTAYTAHLEELVPLFNGVVAHKPGRIEGTRTSEGPAAVREAIIALHAQKPMGSVVFSDGLAAAARSLALDQARTGATGHVGSDGSSPAMRLARQGTWTVSFAESVSYGNFTTGRDVVIDLLVDDGQFDRAHRRNILDPTVRVVGVACAPHPKLGSVCVVEQAGGFVTNR